MVVRPTATGTITNSVAVTSTETDEKPNNNTDTEDTTVNLFSPCCGGDRRWGAVEYVVDRLP
jgi:hypothetical protein